MDELLTPYRALDLSDEKGMLCGKLLAHMGADVIKCEPPGGDPSRRIGPFYGDDPEKSLFWFDSNIGKRGVTINLENEDGRQILRKLVKQVDFLIESYDPGYLGSIGLGYAELSRLNPRLIMVAITPYGQSGPKAGYKATDLTVWASTGVMYCAGDEDQAPNWVGVPQARVHAGLEGTLAILTALHYRNLTGEGQYIDVSMQASPLDALLDTPEIWLFLKRDYMRHGISDFVTKVTQTYGLPCKDGYVAFYTLGGGVLASAEHLSRVRDWMVEEGKIPDWFANVDFVHDYGTAAINQDIVDRVESVLTEFTMTKTKAELYQRALQDRLIIAPIQNAREVWEDEQLKARGFWNEMPSGESGESIPCPGPCSLLSETPMKFKRPAPHIGEHNQDIYCGDLGLSQDDLSRLIHSGAI